MKTSFFLSFLERIREKGKKLIASIHVDCHDYKSIEVLRKNCDIHFGIGNPCFKHCTVTKLHSKGKVEQLLYDFSMENDVLIPTPSNDHGQPPTSEAAVVSTQPLPISSFNLSLSEKEREDRDQLELPFWKKSEAKIEYVPDDNDDYDEEDPDDDLDF